MNVDVHQRNKSCVMTEKVLVEEETKYNGINYDAQERHGDFRGNLFPSFSFMMLEVIDSKLMSDVFIHSMSTDVHILCSSLVHLKSITRGTLNTILDLR